jgi:hypothetical protein
LRLRFQLATATGKLNIPFVVDPTVELRELSELMRFNSFLLDIE